MALDEGDARDGTGLAGLMAEKLKEIEPKFNVKKGYQNIDAMAQAIVEHFTANAEIATTGTAEDVTPGVGTADVTSTGTIT